ncbi:MAG: ATP synthase F1 subunit delta [Marinilabiliaceae bacterium]|nr:ATP synthase F1 subunit delta [Marinilabiliaceae bacterium]
MNHSLIAVRYAQALFKIAREKGLENQIHDNMNLINKTLNESSDLKLFLLSPIQKNSEKKRVLTTLFQQFIHEISLKFLDLIVTKKRENFLQQIIIDYDTLYKQSRNIKSVIFITAVKLNENIVPEIKAIIEKAFESTIELTLKVDEQLLGGFVITVDGKLLDASIAHKLLNLKKKLLN